MLLMKYIREHLPFHFLVVFIYGVFFFFVLMLTSELLYLNGQSGYSVNETSYAFDIKYNNNRFNDLNLPLENVEDISLYVNKDEYTLVSFLTEISSRRSADVQISGLSTDEVASSSFSAVVTQVSEENKIEISSREYIYRGSVNIIFNDNVSDGIKMVCSLDTLHKAIVDTESVKIVFMFEQPLKNNEIKLLQDYVYDKFGTYTYIEPVSEVEEFISVYSNNLFFIICLCVLCFCCFIRVVLAVIQEREKEYTIMIFCGASKRKILLFTIDHLMFIFNASVIVGSLIYLMTRSFLQVSFLSTKDNLLLFLLSYVVFVLIGTVISITILMFRRNRYGYKTK